MLLKMFSLNYENNQKAENNQNGGDLYIILNKKEFLSG